METEPIKRSHSAHRKRRERAHQLQLEKLSKSDDESAEDDKDPNSAGKDRGRSRPRKKRSGAGTYEEDIIDGFAIVSFKTVDDLEKFAAGKLSSKKNISARQLNNGISPGRHKFSNLKKNDRRPPTNLPKIKKPNNSLVNSEDSGETTDNLDTSDLILNGPSRIVSRRFSDVSTRSSSGAGYMCDSESGDEHISDASTDTFSSTPINRSFNRDVIPGSVQVTPPFTSVTSPYTAITPPFTSATTAVCMVTTTTSDITVTTVTTTTSCDSLATTPKTTPVITTTATPAVIDSNQHSYLPNNCHSHLVNHNNNNNTNNNNQLQPSDIHQKSDKYTNNHHQSDNFIANHHKSDNYPASLHQSDSYPASHQKVDNYPTSHQKVDNYPTSHQKVDNYPTSHLKVDNYPPNQQKVDNYPSSHQKIDNYPPNHQKVDNYPTSHKKADNYPTSHQSDNYSAGHRHSNHQNHTPVTREPSQSVQKPDVIRNHDSSKQSSSPSLKRVHSSSIPPTPPLTKSQPSQPKLHHSASTSSLPSNSVIREPKRTPTPSRTPRREEARERESHQVLPPSLSVSKSFLGIQGHHGSTTPILYSPLGPSPGLTLPLHSTPSHSTFPGPASISPLHPHPSGASHTSHNMFAPPMPLGPPAGPLGGATPAPPPPDPDMLREELNRRFLQSSQDRSLVQALPGYLRADFHQHMHQHQHQHTHNHTYHGGLGPPPPGASPVVPPPAAHLYDYRPGLPHRPRGHIAEPDPRHIANGKDKPVHPQHPASAIPGLPGYSSLLLNPAAPPGAGPISSGLSGAFQPKNVSSLHPAHQLLMPMRDRDKSGIPPSPQPAHTGAKKAGKWCAAHVRIAWEIHHVQQKTSEKGPAESKMGDPLRPPSHLLPGSMLQRSQDYPSSTSMSVLASGRGLFDTSPHSLLGAGVPPMAAPAFPRPSPYSIGTSLNLGTIGNGLVSTSREPAISISSGSHEWNRLHRTPPTFPTPPAWAKPEEREKDFERERSLERRREEERERERRLSIDDRHRFQSLDERSRDRLRDNDILVKSRSRSRSRSPVRNGRVDSARSSDRRYDENPLLKIKEERREREDILSERDRILKTEMAERENMLKNEFLRTADPFLQASMLDRTRMLAPGFLGGDRLPNPAALWNPFDKGALDIQNHRLGLQREMEQNRNPLISRFPHPQTVTAGMAMLEQERIKEEILMREERARREYIDGLPLFEKERLFYENSKIPSLRPPDHLAGLGHHFPRTLSPALGHPSLIKRSSPAVIPGAPPPLIHSVCAPPNRGHNPAALNKTKGVSPIDSVGESKCDSNSNSTDPDAHSR